MTPERGLQACGETRAGPHLQLLVRDGYGASIMQHGGRSAACGDRGPPARARSAVRVLDVAPGGPWVGLAPLDGVPQAATGEVASPGWWQVPHEAA